MATIKDNYDRYKRISALRQVTLFKFEFFEKATEDSINQLKEDLKRKEELLLELSRDMPDIDENDYHNITDEEWGVIDEYSKVFMNIDFIREYLLSLLEMNVVYLFKNLEGTMKKFIQIAHPKSDSKDLYHWENLKAFFKSNDIEIVKLEGYEESTELRRVNNAIKHNGIISDEIRRIVEFANQSDFNHINLENFYRRVRPKIQQFSHSLRNKVEENFFEFTSRRLENMADELSQRMDAITLNAFIVRLQERLPSDQNWDIPDVANDLPF